MEQPSARNRRPAVDAERGRNSGAAGRSAAADVAAIAQVMSLSILLDTCTPMARTRFRRVTAMPPRHPLSERDDEIAPDVISRVHDKLTTRLGMRPCEPPYGMRMRMRSMYRDNCTQYTISTVRLTSRRALCSLLQ